MTSEEKELPGNSLSWIIETLEPPTIHHHHPKKHTFAHATQLNKAKPPT
jgi:hypothetical protein